MPIRKPPTKVSPVLKAIQAEAERQEVTAYRLARLAGLRDDTTARLLGGVGSPTLATLEAAAKALGLTIKVERNGP